VRLRLGLRQAAEAISGVRAAAARLALRALLLERERVANHLGDLGALGNDAAFRLRPDAVHAPQGRLAAAQRQVFGHRLLMDRIVPGGVAVDIDARAVAAIVEQCDVIGAKCMNCGESTTSMPACRTAS
jgi:Ni,Fe-hydrogenase III large subunit